MLPASTIDIIKATVPALAAHGETLTRHFYRRMFTGNPEVKAFFNPAHQHTGSQQRALAAAICAYAAHIERPEALAEAIELIAQKHASLGVMPEHYPIVGQHLLASIREVLDDAATDDVVNAWAAAYGVLADVLIRREAEIYRDHEASHGWRGFEPFVVAEKRPESRTITSFHLAPKSGTALRAFTPGQYITVRVPGPEEATTMRNYSLSGRPGTECYRISVKRESGLAADAPVGHVSNYLHDRVVVGDTIEVGPPCGEFTLDAREGARRPLVFISGGVGITPVLSMLHAAVALGRRDRDIWFIHGAINGDSHAFRTEVLELAAAHPRVHAHFRYSEPTSGDREHELFHSEGFINANTVRSLIGGPDADFYLCGPKPFMAGLLHELPAWGVDPMRLRHEFFGPAQQLQPGAAIDIG
ncbi:MAG: NO-inducible flavohemoprotein [Tepidisphaeraceae bacterium]